MITKIRSQSMNKLKFLLKFTFSFLIPMSLYAANGIEFTEKMKGFIDSANTRLKNGFESELEVYNKAFRKGEKEDSNFMFHLTVSVKDSDKMAHLDQERKGTMSGSVETNFFNKGAAEKLTVTEGEFRLLTNGNCSPDDKIRDLKKMCYSMTFNRENKLYLMYGFKYVKKDNDNVSLAEIWSDTSTLYITILEYPSNASLSEANSKGSVIARGVLNILPLDFAEQMTTMKVIRDDNSTSISLQQALQNEVSLKDIREEQEHLNLRDDFIALINFASHFAGSIWEVYFSTFKENKEKQVREIYAIFNELITNTKESNVVARKFKKFGSWLSLSFKKLFKINSTPRKNRTMETNDIEIKKYSFRVPKKLNSRESIQLELIRYNAEKPKSEESSNPVFLIQGLGVDNGIFTQTTTEKNMLEYLLENKRDVWMVNFRANIHLDSAKDKTYNADDIALIDIPYAVHQILEISKAQGIHLVGHCYGSMTLFMSLLSGLNDGYTLPNSKSILNQEVTLKNDIIKSVFSSQVSLYVEVPEVKLAQIKLIEPLLENTDIVNFLPSSPNYVDTSNPKEVLLNQSFKNIAALTAPALYPEDDRRVLYNDAHHRIQFIFGELYKTENLTSDMVNYGLAEIFGPVGIGHIKHLIKMTNLGHIAKADSNEMATPGNDLINNGSYVSTTNIQRLTMPITFIHGLENRTWLLDGTRKSFNQIVQTNGNEDKKYKFFEIEKYGHLDSIYGINSSVDIYPKLNDHLNQVINN